MKKLDNIKFIIITAVSVDGVIGVGDVIPWRIPEDMKHFRETTLNNMLLVGYNTYFTLPPKALEDREYIVLNGAKPFKNNRMNVYQFRCLDSVLDVLSQAETVNKVFIAGGANIYEQFIDYCDEAIITYVNKTYPHGDKKFPIEKLNKDFKIIKSEPGDGWMTSKNNIEYKIINYKRK